MKDTILQASCANRVSAPDVETSLSGLSVIAYDRGLGGAVKARRMTWWVFEFSGVEGAVVAIAMMFGSPKQESWKDRM